MPNNNIYVGERYIPIYDGYWSNTKDYEALTIVTQPSSNSSYISRRPVPAGTPLTNNTYWALQATGNQDLDDLKNQIQTVQTNVDNLSQTVATDSGKITALETSNQEIIAKNTEQDTAIAGNTTNITNVTEEVNTLTTNVNTSLDNLTKQDENFEDRISALENAEVKGGNYAWKLASDYEITPGTDCFSQLAALTANDYIAFPAGEYLCLPTAATTINAHCYFMEGSKFRTKSKADDPDNLLTFVKYVKIDDSDTVVFPWHNVKIYNPTIHSNWFDATYDRFFDPSVAYLKMYSSITVYGDIQVNHDMVIEGIPTITPILQPAASNHKLTFNNATKFKHLQLGGGITLQDADYYIFDSCKIMMSNAKIFGSNSQWKSNFYFKNCTFSKYSSAPITLLGICGGSGVTIIDGCRTEYTVTEDSGTFIGTQYGYILNSKLDIGSISLMQMQPCFIQNSEITCSVSALHTVINSTIKLNNGTTVPWFKFVANSTLRFLTQFSYKDNDSLFYNVIFNGDNEAEQYSHTFNNAVYISCSFRINNSQQNLWNLESNSSYLPILITCTGISPVENSTAVVMGNNFNPLLSLEAHAVGNNGIPTSSIPLISGQSSSFYCELYGNLLRPTGSFQYSQNFTFEAFTDSSSPLTATGEFISGKKYKVTITGNVFNSTKYIMVYVKYKGNFITSFILFNSNAT